MASVIVCGMGLGDLTVSAVNSAIDEYEQLGGEAFRARYGFGPSKDFFVIRGGKSYDSKAIAGAAHRYLPGKQPLAANEFSGGEATVARRLRQLGFRVPLKRSPPWVCDEVILACDLVAKNDWKYVTAEDPRVVELSARLQQLPFQPDRGPE